MLEIEVLGCGASVGVPAIGCKCSVCKSDSSYNKRLRSSIIINQNKTKILVDFGFDVKQQLIQADVSYLDAAILTHDHADHVSGIDELRAFHFISGKPLDVYVNEAIAPVIFERYNYLFNPPPVMASPRSGRGHPEPIETKNHKEKLDGHVGLQPTRHDKPLVASKLKMHPVNEVQGLNIAGVKLQLFPQIHGPIKSLGLRVEDFVYSCDVSGIPPESEKYLENIQTWLVDCMGYGSSFAHAGLDRVLQWDEKYRPKKIYLTNMSHNIDYHEIITQLPAHIRPSYDGLVLKF